MLLFTLALTSTLFLSGLLLYNYGDWFRHRLAVTLCVWLAWFCAFFTVALVPIDVVQTILNNECDAKLNASHVENENSTLWLTDDSPDESSGAVESSTMQQASSSLVPPMVLEKRPEACISHDVLHNDLLLHTWQLVYWLSQLLTWFVLPMMQSFAQAGEFTFWGKLKSALWDNGLYYTSLLFIALLLLLYITMQPQLHITVLGLKTIAAAASNTWGLFFLVLMLGYGLVEVPRNFYKRSLKGYTLNRGYFQVSKLMSERSDAEENLDEILASVYVVSTSSHETLTNRKYKAHLDTIMSKIPTELMERTKRRCVRGGSHQIFNNNNELSEKTLIKLHFQLIRALHNHKRTQAQWDDLTHKVFELEDVNRNMVSNERLFKHSDGPPNDSLLRSWLYTPKVEWYYKCAFMPFVLKGAALVAVAMSAIVIWSEATFFSQHPPLSLLALFVRLSVSSNDYLMIELTCLITICYLCLCTYYTVFKIRVLNVYYLASKHQSDEFTLLFSGALLCRLTPALALNFLSLIHMDSHVSSSETPETSYTKVMGHMDVLAIVSDYFNVYFPMALIILTTMTYFNFGSRIINVLGFAQFLGDDNEVTQQLIDEGREHVKRERRRVQRLKEAKLRRDDFNSRFAATNSDNLPTSSTPLPSTTVDVELDCLLQGTMNEVEEEEAMRQRGPQRGIEVSATEINDGLRTAKQMGLPKNLFDDI